MELSLIAAFETSKKILFFISYSSASSRHVADWLFNKLIRKRIPEEKIFFDQKDMTQFQDMNVFMKQSYSCLVILSHDYLTRPNCVYELALALKFNTRIATVYNESLDFQLNNIPPLSPEVHERIAELGNPETIYTNCVQKIKNVIYTDVSDDADRGIIEILQKLQPQHMSRAISTPQLLNTSLMCPKCHQIINVVIEKRWTGAAECAWWLCCFISCTSPLFPAVWESMKLPVEVCPKCHYTFLERH